MVLKNKALEVTWTLFQILIEKPPDASHSLRAAYLMVNKNVSHLLLQCKWKRRGINKKTNNNGTQNGSSFSQSFFLFLFEIWIKIPSLVSTWCVCGD